MTGGATLSGDGAPRATAEERLESWKEIAAYLKRDVRTVQRWERRGALPVHRREENLGGVYAFRAELDAWRRNGHSQLEEHQPEKAGGTREDQPRRFSRAIFVWSTFLATLALLGALGFYSYRYHRQTGKSERPPLIVPFMTLPGWSMAPTFSPDGKEVAFAWDNHDDNGSFDIYVMRVGSSEPRRLTFHPSRFVWPRWSPDSGSIAFTRESESESGVFLISSKGGPERKLLSLDWPSLPGSLDVTWTPDGKHLAFVETNSPVGTNRIALLSLDTLEHHALTQPPSGGLDEGPEVSPDGRTLAFLRGDSTGFGSVYVAPTSGGEPTVLATIDGNVRGLAWFPDGQALLMAGRIRGVEGLWKIELGGQSKLLYSTVKTKPAFPAITAQGNRVAVSLLSYEESIWQVDLTKKGSSASFISTLNGAAEFPQYSPDGQRIAFQSDRSGTWEIWGCDRDGLNPVQLTSFAGPPVGYPRWAPDGRQIVFDVRSEHGSEIYVVSRDGGSLRRLVTGGAKDEVPSWSQDGRWIYFASDHGGVWQIWKTPIEGGHAVQVTKNGGYAPVESLSGKRLFYAKGPDSSGIWSVDERGNEYPVLNILPQGHWADWAVSEDGLYFIDPLAKPRPAIEFFSYATRRITSVLRLETYPQQGVQGLAVSPDRRWLLYPRLKVQGDIVFVQNLQ